jgi:thiaminase/transcriptional activator TenA
MKFSEYLWQKTKPIYKEIINHPFNVELADGTLDYERFHFYMKQDARYLVDFSRVLALIAGKATEAPLIHQFLNFSLGALIAEREIYTQFLRSDCKGDIDPTPACVAYTRYLLSTVTTASMEESLAAILPCFWSYREMGRDLVQQVKPDHPYALWIQTYSSPESSENTDQIIAMLDNMAKHCSQKLLTLMKETFERCFLFEWHFWNDAYNMTLLYPNKLYTSDFKNWFSDNAKASGFNDQKMAHITNMGHFSIAESRELSRCQKTNF